MTTPMTVEQIDLCRVLVDALDPMPPDPVSEEIRQRALERARRERESRHGSPPSAEYLAAKAALSRPSTEEQA